MGFNHLVLIGGGHSNVLLIRKWLMNPSLMPDSPISIISRDFNLVYSAMYPGVIAGEFKIDECLIDICSLANRAKISFINDEVRNINFINKKIIFDKRLNIEYSNLVINIGSETKIPKGYYDLVVKNIAFPIKPFYKSYQIIKKEDFNNSQSALPFVIVGSGLAAIEIAFALRKRWKLRSLILVCDIKKINSKIIRLLKEIKINLSSKINFSHGRILLCTGNKAPFWIQNSLLELDKKGRIKTTLELKAHEFPDIFAVGDCAVIKGHERPASGIFAVKVVNTLAKNIKKDFKDKRLQKWSSQRKGLQIVKTFNRKFETFAIYGGLIIYTSSFFGFCKNKIDKNFVKKFKLIEMNSYKKKTSMTNYDCRGCAAKIPRDILNTALKETQLGGFADFPEDATEIFKNDKQLVLQSIDGFPAILSDPWLNAQITTLHACSDLWACGVKLSSINILISLPKVEKEFQHYLFTQSLNGINTVANDLGGKIVGGHTYESRNLSDKPYPLGIDIALNVTGFLVGGKKPWRKSGMNSGDILLMSRPLGIGIFFAAQMRGITLFDSYRTIIKNLLTSQQKLIDDIYKLQDSLGKTIINASTDVTGFGLLGHLKEMVDASNNIKIKNNEKTIKAIIDLSLIKAYPEILKLIKSGIKSSLFNENKKIYDKLISQKLDKRSIIFAQPKYIIEKDFLEIIELILDPQTCGPLLISCKPVYEEYLKEDWYKIGEII